MNGHRWIRVTTCDSIPPREGRPVLLGSREIAIFNLGGSFLATDNRCPHQGGPLCDGIVSGDAVVCPLHAWKISLQTGAVQRPPQPAPCGAGQVATYATRVVDGVVLVEVPS